MSKTNKVVLVQPATPYFTAVLHDDKTTYQDVISALTEEPLHIATEASAERSGTITFKCGDDNSYTTYTAEVGSAIVVEGNLIKILPIEEFNARYVKASAYDDLTLDALTVKVGELEKTLTELAAQPTLDRAKKVGKLVADKVNDANTNNKDEPKDEPNKVDDKVETKSEDKAKK